MRCEQVRELLSPYIDQMTSEKENQAIEAHLVQCLECRRELEQLKLLCSMLNDLESPQVPENLAQDIHRRLREEKTKILAFREARRPKKSGWIAAAIAGLALAVGIGVSSLLPVGSIMALWQDKTAEQDAKPKVAIEKILDAARIAMNTDNKGADDSIGGNNSASNQKGDNKPAVTGQTGKLNAPEKNSSSPVNVAENPIKPVIVQEYATRIKTDNLNESVNKVIQIADVSGLEYNLSQGKTVQGLQASNTKEVTFKVEAAQLEGVLAKLESAGQVASPVENKRELTAQYQQVQDKINTLDKQVNALEEKPGRTAEEEAELADLKADLNNCCVAKENLDKEASKVTLKILLFEEVNH